ncbi:MAG: hypothetical protein ACR2JF_14370 [Iamia sp.]
MAIAPSPRNRARRSSASGDRVRLPRHDLIDIFLVSFAGLLLEISYTRVISHKLFYYYTYLIIGLALLGIGTGGVAVAVSRRLREARLSTVLGWGSGLAAISVAAGFIVIARTPMTTLDIWDYGAGRSFDNLARLLVICFALFAPFALIGVMIATLFGRRTDGIARLYFADLVGAGLATGIVVFLIRGVGPPTVIMGAGLVLAAVAVGRAVPTRRAGTVVPAAVLVVLLVAGVVGADSIEIKVDDSKQFAAAGTAIHSEWSPIFRVDAAQIDDRILLYHDGLLGSGIFEFDGNVEGLTRFDTDPRAFPFEVLGDPADDVMIVGAAGGHEILASLYFDAAHMDAIELNPVTHDLLQNKYADYAGNIASRPEVNYVLDDGRSFLERSESEYDLIWYPAPDSYAAANAATSGAFVLSESYLYTSETITASLDHLTDDGILAAQFGEVDYEAKPNRTARYLSTVRAAFGEMGVDDPGSHVLVATSPTDLGATAVSTILVKRTPFTPEEVARFTETARTVPDAELRYVPGGLVEEGVAADILTLPDDELDQWYDDYRFDVRAISDDAPYFWNFARYRNVVRDVGQPINSTDPEAGTGERVLLLLLAVAVLFAIIFLLLPFLAIRSDWKALPRKPVSALYFACLGFGFLFFEITLIQRLTLFLGYPTYSLTVTLASILLFTGIGALLSDRVVGRGWKVGLWLLGALAVLTAFYELALPALTDSLFDLSLTPRIVVAFLVLAPLGLCLGMFMPLGLGAVGRLSPLSREYVAWGWAVNGFASVMGSVLTTLLSMTFGFRTVMLIALGVYAVAVVALRSLMATPPIIEDEPPVEHEGEADTALVTA